ncbi:carboxypeptidase-like regulatory domain-containing protein [Wohlfahrtiimonas populi]|uniref:carboxypeptidase-like regulatory domain-containing protein n=1 Tax=Wohlfahrtiimonas populi TaxID=1940240 RepID=UPI00098D289E|nr:carboxypeptidase-like regulatory domain-containing protein [Wohlfahrtiimonas populi]
MIQTGTLYTVDSTGTPTGVPIKGATIVFKQNNSVIKTVQTDVENGEYTIDLEPGKYLVEVAKGNITIAMRAGQLFDLKDSDGSDAFQRWLYSKSGDIDDQLLNSFKEIADQANKSAIEANESAVKSQKIYDSIVDEIEDFANSPITKGYDENRHYESGDIVKVNGIYYECYAQNGCKGIDPADPKNRPSGWESADIHAQYHWIEIGKFLMLPEIGSPIYLPSTVMREALIKYRNDGLLSAKKYWRIAELYPNLVKNGFITIADLRSMTIRGLDDGRGIDVGREINSYQEDATQLLKGSLASLYRAAAVSSSGALYVSSYGSTPAQQGTGAGDNVSAHLDNSRSIRTSTEERVKNIAMLIGCRI